MPGESWWAEEIPSPVEIAEAKVSLKRADKHVDYILTHCPPPEVYRRFAIDENKIRAAYKASSVRGKTRSRASIMWGKRRSRIIILGRRHFKFKRARFRNQLSWL